MSKILSLFSLGCFRNSYDSNVVIKSFLDQGYIFKEGAKRCDILVVNTCGFIDKAKEESVDAVRQAVELKTAGKVKKILVLGCLVQRYRSQLERRFPEVDFWQGVVKVDQQRFSISPLLPKHIAFLKICEGCINKCSYCAIPLIKGPLKSRSKANILQEVKFLNDNGIKELNIIGQDITAWGIDTNEGALEDLVSAIVKAAKNIPWIRLIYTHPRHFSQGLIDLIAQEKKICKYIDLPIQHINDRILKLMNRSVGKKQLKELLHKIRCEIPGVAMRTSVICGFPTETEKEHEELLRFLSEYRFERLGAFVYSREEGTPAYDFKQVHPARAKRRQKEIMLAQQMIMQQYSDELVGKKIEILVEKESGQRLTARSYRDAYDVDGVVYLPKRYEVGRLHEVEVKAAIGCDLEAA